MLRFVRCYIHQLTFDPNSSWQLLGFLYIYDQVPVRNLRTTAKPCSVKLGQPFLPITITLKSGAGMGFDSVTIALRYEGQPPSVAGCKASDCGGRVALPGHDRPHRAFNWAPRSYSCDRLPSRSYWPITHPASEPSTSRATSLQPASKR